jgi:hypothetical protein
LRLSRSLDPAGSRCAAAGTSDDSRMEERVVVVAPLREGAREVARMLLEAGPPFDPAGVGLRAHEVLLTEAEAVFVFEGEDAGSIVEELVGRAEVWEAAREWRDWLAERPRVAEQAYVWP